MRREREEEEHKLNTAGADLLTENSTVSFYSSFAVEPQSCREKAAEHHITSENRKQNRKDQNTEKYNPEKEKKCMHRTIVFC